MKIISQTLTALPPLRNAMRGFSLPEPVYRHLHFEGLFTVTCGARTFRLHSYGDVVENELFWAKPGKGWEGRSLLMWQRMVADADAIADVGANTGVFALMAQALRPQARVIAVEPSRRVHRRLRANIALNDFPIIASEAAASDRTGIAIFYEHDGAHQYSSSLDPEIGGSTEVQTPVIRLDDLFGAHGVSRIDAMKLDVERHESEALAGMAGTLAASDAALLVEILGPEEMAQIAAVVEPLGYEIRAVTTFDIPCPIDAATTGDDRNYVIARPERMAALTG